MTGIMDPCMYKIKRKIDVQTQKTPHKRIECVQTYSFSISTYCEWLSGDLL